MPVDAGGRARRGFARFVFAAALCLFTLVFVLFRGFSGANTYVDLPYALDVFCGLVLWMYFLDAPTSSAGAIRLDSALLTKVYYPRLLTPLRTCSPVAGLMTGSVSPREPGVQEPLIKRETVEFICSDLIGGVWNVVHSRAWSSASPSQPRA